MRQIRQAMRHYYTIKEAANALEVTKRTIQRKCASLNVAKDNGAYIITEDVLRQMRRRTTESTDIPNTIEHTYGVGLHEQEDGTMLQVFTKDEYKQFEAALIERNHLLKQVAELRQWKDDFIKYTNQRNTIEAHDKGIIKHLDHEEVEDHAEDIQQHLIAKRKEVIKDKAAFSKWMENLKD